jgi:hypothetical protein
MGSSLITLQGISFFFWLFFFSRFVCLLDSLCPLGRPLLIGQTIGARALVPCVEETIPEGEEGLGEVGLDAPGLVVDVVVGGVVAGDELERVPGEGVAAVVVDGLDGGEGEEEGALTDVHAGGLEGDGGTEAIEEKALERVVVEGAVCVWDVEAVVAGVESCWRKGVSNGLGWKKTVE